ncbi:MAG: hypothetical protein LBE91_11160 [Tannerella sp.]|nr:hypothetical protein [Tannerella sp.]
MTIILTQKKIIFFLLFLIFFISCTRKSNQLANAEIHTATGDSIKAMDVVEPFHLTLIYGVPISFYKMKYEITDKNLKISDISFELLPDSVVYETQLSQDILDELSIINMDTLKEDYYTPGIMDGYYISVNLGNKTVSASNYYLVEIGFVVEKINHLIPEKYKIWYKKEKVSKQQRR